MAKYFKREKQDGTVFISTKKGTSFQRRLRKAIFRSREQPGRVKSSTSAKAHDGKPSKPNCARAAPEAEPGWKKRLDGEECPMPGHASQQRVDRAVLRFRKLAGGSILLAGPREGSRELPSPSYIARYHDLGLRLSHTEPETVEEWREAMKTSNRYSSVISVRMRRSGLQNPPPSSRNPPRPGAGGLF
jgi:hypothetical protein